jgi:uncharacterized protein (DUF302 family)
MRFALTAAALSLALIVPAAAQQNAAVAKAAKPQPIEPGLVMRPSALSVKETIDKLAKAVEEKGAKVVARVDHAAGAKAVGADMKPSEVLMFGNPKLGTPVMQGNLRAGLDLPLKMLAYEDAAGKVWLVYTAPAALKARYRINDATADATLKTMATVLDGFATAATTK